MLSKKDVDLLYACVAEIPGRLSFLPSPFAVVGAGALSVPSAVVPGVSPIGEPEAMASLMRSSLLNLAFADSKS
jgi:hypothetical protein